MQQQSNMLNCEASYAKRHLKWMARGRFIYLRFPNDGRRIELTRKSAYDYLAALGETSITVLTESERLVIVN